MKLLNEFYCPKMCSSQNRRIKLYKHRYVNPLVFSLHSESKISSLAACTYKPMLINAFWTVSASCVFFVNKKVPNIYIFTYVHVIFGYKYNIRTQWLYMLNKHIKYLFTPYSVLFTILYLFIFIHSTLLNKSLLVLDIRQ